MSLGEFKTIFWWEWVHRILARGVGAVFALPLLLFWATGRLEQGVKPKLVGLLRWGGCKARSGGGWWPPAWWIALTSASIGSPRTCCLLA